MTRCGVVVVAGGTGSRAGGEIPKQFRPLLERPLLLWSLDFFCRCGVVGPIVIACHADYLQMTSDLLAADGLLERTRVVAGGARRQDSVLAGLEALEADVEIAAVHDAARPFPPADLETAVKAALRVGGAIYATAVTDSIKRVESGQIAASVPRENLWAAQTPQLAQRKLLLQALRECVRRGLEVTDEASALEIIRCQVEVVESPRTNLKITRPEDWIVAEAIARSRQE